MAVKPKTVAKKKTTVLTPRKVCSKCLTEKVSKENFYMASDNIIHEDGRLGICKICLEGLVDMDAPESLITLMRKIDRPFFIDDYEASLPHANPFGEYMRRVAMPQNKGKTFLDSMFNESLERLQAKSEKELNKTIDIDDMVQFKITPDIVLKWGSGYSEADLFQLEQFYIDMKNSNQIETPQHIAQLKLLCKLDLEQNNLLAAGNYTAFKTINQQYSTILRDSGFRPIDRVGGNESVGIRSFSQIWEKMEEDGFVPKHKVSTTQDIIDGTILHLENYTRRYLNMQTVAEPSGDIPKVEDYE